MELKVTKENITSAEVVFSDTNEQSIELDYILPDYYPEIFKILKCIVKPCIVSQNIDKDKLIYEMSVCIRILYSAENSSAVNIIDQKLTYSKKVDIGRICTTPEISIVPQINYINCRAVNSRRIDMRGAISTSVMISDLICNNAISDVVGGNIQLKKVSLTYPSNQINIFKPIIVSDKFDLGLSKPSIINIVRNDAIVTSIDKKIIANKLIVKGEICINMLYTCIKDNNDSLEAMQFTLPFSNVIDIEGLDDRYECVINPDIVSCDITPCSDGDGNSKIAECTINVLVSVSAYKTSTADLAVDAYSTSFSTNNEKKDIFLEASPQIINNMCVIKSTLTSTDDEIDCIFDAWCNLKNISIVPDMDEKCLKVNGTVTYIVIAKNIDKNPVLIEKEESYSVSVPVENISENLRINLKLIPVSCSYNLTSDNTIEIKAELKATGYINNIFVINGITEIIINEDEPINKNNKYALKIYYTDENEDLWEIAKKYGTSVSAIIEENEIEDDTIAGNGMILIPIV